MPAGESLSIIIRIWPASIIKLTMLNLTKEEKLVLVFLTAVFLIGSGADFFKKRYTSAGSLPGFQKEVRGETAVNINKAGAVELMKLKGVGEKTACAILDYREENGPFFSKEDIMRVKGIGEAKFTLIKDRIKVE